MEAASSIEHTTRSNSELSCHIMKDESSGVLLIKLTKSYQFEVSVSVSVSVSVTEWTSLSPLESMQSNGPGGAVVAAVAAVVAAAAAAAVAAGVILI